MVPEGDEEDDFIVPTTPAAATEAGSLSDAQGDASTRGWGSYLGGLVFARAKEPAPASEPEPTLPSGFSATLNAEEEKIYPAEVRSYEGRGWALLGWERVRALVLPHTEAACVCCKELLIRSFTQQLSSRFFPFHGTRVHQRILAASLLCLSSLALCLCLTTAVTIIRSCPLGGERGTQHLLFNGCVDALPKTVRNNMTF